MSNIPQMAFTGDSPWSKVKNHLKQTQVNEHHAKKTRKNIPSGKTNTI